MFNVDRYTKFEPILKPKEWLDMFQGKVLAQGGTFENYDATLNFFTQNQDAIEASSIVITPNGRSLSKVYAFKPYDGTGDLTYTRNSAATETNEAGLIANSVPNMPRLNYVNGVASWLSEPQRTNLLTYSNDFTNGSWIKQSGTTIVSTNHLSPDGALNASFVTGSGTSGILKILTDLTPSTPHIRTIYLKGTLGGEVVQVRDPSTGGANPKTLTTSWARYAFLQSSGVTGGLWIDDIPATGIYIYGAQLEAGSYATSYIPTVASAVTRVADSFVKTGLVASLGSLEGATYFEFAKLQDNTSESVPIFSISDGTINNRIDFYIGTPGLFYWNFVKAGTSISNGSIAVANMTSIFRISYYYSATNFKIAINGAEVVNIAVNASFLLGTMNQIGFKYGNGGGTSIGKYGYIMHSKVAADYDKYKLI